MGIARHIKKLAGYVPGEQPKSRNVVKLNTNENPYPPSPRCAKVLSSFNLDDLRRYPDPNFSALAKAIADENGTTADRVFVGNGSDEILSLAAFKDGAYHRKTVAKVVKTRKAFEKDLLKRGWDVIKSESNFVFAKPPAGAAAKDVFSYLKSREIYVRYFPGPLTGDRLRITIGTDGQMETLLDALDDRFRGEEKTRKTSKQKTRKQPPRK